jgi:hypothetical protein
MSVSLPSTAWQCVAGMPAAGSAVQCAMRAAGSALHCVAQSPLGYTRREESAAGATALSTSVLSLGSVSARQFIPRCTLQRVLCWLDRMSSVCC